jgi:hypothetical protein
MTVPAASHVREQFVSGTVWRKSENAKRKHSKVMLTADKKSAAMKLRYLEKRGEADRRGIHHRTPLVAVELWNWQFWPKDLTTAVCCE